jgi:hypothetical protein
MATLIRYTPNFRGIKRLRSSRDVDRELERRAHEVANAAQSTYDGDPPESGRVEVEVVQSASDTSEPRARVAVIARHPAALAIEAERRVLGGSLDAAR